MHMDTISTSVAGRVRPALLGVLVLPALIAGLLLLIL
jgi:hypothetical protein